MLLTSTPSPTASSRSRVAGDGIMTCSWPRASMRRYAGPPLTLRQEAEIMLNDPAGTTSIRFVPMIIPRLAS